MLLPLPHRETFWISTLSFMLATPSPNHSRATTTTATAAHPTKRTTPSAVAMANRCGHGRPWSHGDTWRIRRVTPETPPPRSRGCGDPIRRRDGSVCIRSVSIWGESGSVCIRIGWWWRIPRIGIYTRGLDITCPFPEDPLAIIDATEWAGLAREGIPELFAPFHQIQP